MINGLVLIIITRTKSKNLHNAGLMVGFLISFLKKSFSMI